MTHKGFILNSTEADAEKDEEIKLDQQKQRVQPPTSGPEETVYGEVDGTAVLHPGSEHTGNIQTVTWKLNSFKIAEWDGMDVLFYGPNKGEQLNMLTSQTPSVDPCNLSVSPSLKF
ncbi:uncharacterized protein V6R79_004302 [Siganus canaliculatus]